MQVTRKRFFQTMIGAAAAGGFMSSAVAPLLLAQEKARIPAKATKIRDIEILPYTVPQRIVIKVALPVSPSANNIFVRLRTEDGVIGVGESSPYSPVTSETQQSDVAFGRTLTELVRGRDPFTLAKIVDDMDGLSPHNPSIKAAFEMAFWDICGKITGQPICCLLGRYRDTFETDQTIGIQTPEAMAENAKEIVRQGFRTIKVKVGESPEIDIERLARVREAAGPDINLRIDANQAWTAAETLQNLRGMEKYHIQACEQPVPYWDLEGLKFIHDHSSIPLMADESVHAPHDVIELARRNAVDLINIKLMKSGGILNAVRIAQVSAATGIKCMLGSMSESSLALTAAAHVVASQKNIIWADLDAALFLAKNPIVGGMEIKQGMVHLPPAPGLGLEIDPDFLKTLSPA